MLQQHLMDSGSSDCSLPAVIRMSSQTHSLIVTIQNPLNLIVTNLALLLLVAQQNSLTRCTQLLDLTALSCAGTHEHLIQAMTLSHLGAVS